MSVEQIERDLGFLRAVKSLDTDDFDQLLTFGELLVVGRRKACQETEEFDESTDGEEY